MPGLGATNDVLPAAALRRPPTRDALPSESVALRQLKARPPRLLDDDSSTMSPLGSPNSLAQAGAAFVNDLASEGRRSGRGTPTGCSWMASGCQVCAKPLSPTAACRGQSENRVCNACQAKSELSTVSSRRLPA